MEKNDGREKRRKVRIPFIYGIEFDDAEEAVMFQDDTQADISTKIVLKDISSDGLQISCPRFFAQGTPVKLTLKFPRWRGVPKDVKVEDSQCMVYAKVRWVAKNQAEKSFRLGLLFTKLEPRSREMIDRYLDDNIVVEEEDSL